ncbi:MAG: hypothetical protein QXR45_06395 [Candidatus Bathyarchaeia archaeon]
MNENLVLFFIFLVIGIGVAFFSLHPVENLKKSRSYVSSHSWSVSGQVERGQVVALDVKASRGWGTITSWREVEQFDACLNFTLLCDDGSVNVTCYYTVYIILNDPTPMLSPKNVSVSGSSVDFLDFGKSGVVDGFLAIGCADFSGNLTVILSGESVWENFLSVDAPAKLTLATYNVMVEYRYIFLLPVAFFFFALSFHVGRSEIRRRKRIRRVRKS